MKNGESESQVRFGVTPFFDVPKIEHRRFWAFPCNKKPGIREFTDGPVQKDKTGPKSQYIRKKLARRASNSGLSGPVSQFIRSKVVRIKTGNPESKWKL